MTRAHHSPPAEFRTLEDVVAVVRAAGGRLSTPRRLLLEALFAGEHLVTADALAATTSIDLTSVYRNLETLESLGVVRHVHLGHGPGLYGLIGHGAREYLVCERCDGLQVLDPADLDDVRDRIREQFGFEATFSHFPIVGVCADCAR